MSAPLQIELGAGSPQFQVVGTDRRLDFTLTTVVVTGVGSGGVGMTLPFTLPATF